MNTYLLEESLDHGTPAMPISIHYTIIPPNEGKVLYLHWHQEFEFLIVTKGGAIFHIENRSYEVHEGEGIFIHPNFLHSATALNGLYCSFYTICFHPSFLSDDINSTLYKKYIKPLLKGKLVFAEHYHRENSWMNRAYSILYELTTFYNVDIEDYELIIRSKMLELWHLFYHNSKPYLKDIQNDTTKAKRLTPVLDFIHTNYNNEISLKTLADIISVSESQLCRLFKDDVGLSPFTYIIRYRILRSCTLLVNSNSKISNIANQIGFSNISYYNREFKSIVGCTPSEYRKNQEK